MKIVLCEIGGNKYSSFSDSIYMTKKSLGLKDIFHIFVPCSKCHKLYKKNEVVDFRQENNPTIMRCSHVEFPNSTLRRSRNCNSSLSQKISGSNKIII